MTLLKKSKFVHELRNDNRLAWFNSFNLKVAYIRPELTSFLEQLTWLDSNHEQQLSEMERQAIHSLTSDGFLVPINANEDELVEEMLRESMDKTPDIHILKLFLTTRCNFNCKYCLIIKNLKGIQGERLDVETLEKALDFFAWHSAKSSRKRKTIFLYGGEPLTNPEVMMWAIRRARELEAEGTLGGELELILETNGSLITPEVAEFLARNRVILIVSLDGPERIHNCMRTYSDGSGTFCDAIRGYRLAREKGCVAVVSTVFGPHVAPNVSEVVTFLAREVQTPSIGLDLLHIIETPEERVEIPIELVVERYIEAFKVARKEGLYVEHIMRRIRPFVEESRRLKDCPACGSRIVVAPDGAVGLCEGFIGSRQYFIGNVTDTQDLRKNSWFLEWNNRTPFRSKTCRECIALSICGGGCVYNAYVQYTDIHGVDDTICATSRGFINWLIEDLYRLLSERTQGFPLMSVHVASVQEKRNLYGRIPPNLDLPLLQTVSKYAERPAGGCHE
ncbi:hypothetical protein SY88_06500 [Clostridiales bacterium PH28_bin88]|nr:hypothetical protein SY88_06500 [Clostridiales bacterium PH28_bin88]